MAYALRLFIALALLATCAGTASAAQDDRQNLSDQIAQLRDELAALKDTLDDVGNGVQERLHLNGYFDFEYAADTDPATHSHFRQHHISLFVTRNWNNWRLFSEIEFEDGTRFSGTGANVSGNGTLKLENSWLEYLHNNYLHIRVGKILTPQYWNAHHYPNTVLTTRRPLMVRNIFPVDFTGILAHGSYYGNSQIGVSYKLYTANGESLNESQTDNNENKAVGGRLIGHLGDVVPGFSRLDIGLSHYAEKNAAGDGFDVSGADAQLTVGPVALLFEYATNHQTRDKGFYIQPSARLLATVQAVYRYDYLDDGTDRHTRHTVGFDWRPMPHLSFKGSVDANRFDTRASFESLNLSVAVYF